MGNPSNAVTDIAQENNYLMSKPQYALSYNRSRAIPNWVSWHLDPLWLGTAPRQDDFREDPTLPAGWFRVQDGSYSGSGFDRGHHCPSADRTNTIPDNSATFLMTNMMPQAPNNNQGPWAQLEEYSRTLVDQGNELYIIMGGAGQGGVGSNGAANTIAGGQIVVPAYTWKVIIVLPNGVNDVDRVYKNTRTIAVIMPNVQGLNTDWKSWRTSVDAVERLTGYNFFSNVRPQMQRIIESRVDRVP
jgi:endonuclease G